MAVEERQRRRQGEAEATKQRMRACGAAISAAPKLHTVGRSARARGVLSPNVDAAEGQDGARQRHAEGVGCAAAAATRAAAAAEGGGDAALAVLGDPAELGPDLPPLPQRLQHEAARVVGLLAEHLLHELVHPLEDSVEGRIGLRGVAARGEAALPGERGPEGGGAVRGVRARTGASEDAPRRLCVCAPRLAERSCQIYHRAGTLKPARPDCIQLCPQDPPILSCSHGSQLAPLGNRTAFIRAPPTSTAYERAC